MTLPKQTRMKSEKVEHEKEALRLEYSFEHGINFKDRIINLNTPIGDATVDLVEFALSELTRESKKAITVKISSPGGSVYDALAIVSKLSQSKCQIVTIAEGHCMSAATLILACGDKRHMSEFCMFMHHKASYAVAGDHESVKDEIEQMEREEKLWSQWMEQMTGTASKFWYESCKKKNVYLTAEECLKLGVIDKVV